MLAAACPVASSARDGSTVSATATYPIYVTDQGRALAMELRSTHGLRPLVTLGSPGLNLMNILMAIAPENLVSVLGETPEIVSRRDVAGAMSTVPTVDGDQPTKSMFQTDCVAIRVRLPVSWGSRSPKGVSWLTITNW